MNANGISRRDLLLGAAAVPLARGLRFVPDGDARCLVAIELAGGNDGLGTLIPVDDRRYAPSRPTLASVRDGALPVGDGFALPSVMPELARLFDRGLALAVHGVGYTPPDRSHFRSRDVWYAADPALERVGADTTGWLGRVADRLAADGAAVPGLSIGSLRVPLLLRGTGVVVPSLHRLEDYELAVDGGSGLAETRRTELAEAVRASAAAEGELAAFVGDVSKAALDSAAKLRAALSRYRPAAEFPGGDFGRALQLVSRVVTSGFGTRLFHVSLGGFDTHARQAPTHAGLLGELSRGLGALVQDLEAHRALDGVTVFVWSEFGRRVAENRSQGTDHGAAAPVFVLGPDLPGGLRGAPPDLDDLDDGDVRVTCDLRRVYASLCARLGVPAEPVLGGSFAPAF